MTFNEAYEILDDMCDKAGTSYFTSAEKKRTLKQGIYEWLETISMEFERDNINIDGIYTLTEGPVTISWSPDTRIGTLPNDFLYRLECFRNVPANQIKYVRFNNWSEIHNDPHNTPNADFPVYRLKANGMEFSGLLNGDIVLFSFIKKPTFASVDNAGEWVNLPTQEQYKVLKHTYKLLTNSMSDQRYQLATDMLKNRND